MKYLLFVAFVLTIPAANWMIGHVGTVCVPDGPCLIPVGFGLMSPSGVLMIGGTIVLRNMVQERLGMRYALAAIACGLIVSFLVAAPGIAIASAAAFVCAELSELFVFTPMRKRGLLIAVLFAGIAGAFVDSAVFLFIAFGNLDHVLGNVVGKIWVTLIAIPIIASLRIKRA